MDHSTDALIRAHIRRSFDTVAAHAAATAPGLGAPRRSRRSLAPLGAAVALAAVTGVAGAVLLHHTPSHPAGGGAVRPTAPTSAPPTPAASTPKPPLDSSGIAADLQGGVLVFGGNAVIGGNLLDPHEGPVDQTWVWHGRWIQLHPATAPSTRTGQVMVADPAQGYVLLFGGDHSQGSTDVSLTDTWTWDGANWTRRAPRHHPGMVHNWWPIAAYDPASRQVVLVDNDSATWTWDGTDWTEHRAAIGLYSPAMIAWDSASGSVLLEARESVSPQTNAASGVERTWRWTGTTWAQLHPARTAEINNLLLFATTDPAGGVIALFPSELKGGAAVMSHWDGHTWTPIPDVSGLGFADAMVTTSTGRVLAVDLSQAAVWQWAGGGRWVSPS